MNASKFSTDAFLAIWLAVFIFSQKMKDPKYFIDFCRLSEEDSPVLRSSELYRVVMRLTHVNNHEHSSYLRILRSDIDQIGRKSNLRFKKRVAKLGLDKARRARLHIDGIMATPELVLVPMIVEIREKKFLDVIILRHKECSENGYRIFFEDWIRGPEVTGLRPSYN